MISGYSKIPETQIMDPQDYKPLCGEVSNTFSVCTAEDDKADAIRKCGPILLGFKNRHCFNKSENQVFKVFSDCLNAACRKDEQACKRLKDNSAVSSCLPQAQTCDTW
ncbi:hypothetical protein Btru_042071 [Bulinus truncatus]|nr:hypothetical protein Btru_042071 [Bulinus truncatus]